jgi:NAD-dependent SIR2 family protein deacetylase
MPPLDDPPIDYSEIRKRLGDGQIVPFFGAGASACYGLPSGEALAADLVREVQFPDDFGKEDLALVASYVVQKKDSIVLRRVVREALVNFHQPGQLHDVLAKCEAIKLYVTTNYDSLLEDALAPRQPWIVVDRGVTGIVYCRKPGGDWIKAKSESLRTVIPQITNPILLKLHGSLGETTDTDSFLITEDQYVDFLGRPPDKQIPSMLFDYMRTRSFLFLGYGLRDWNVRVLLRKLNKARVESEPITSWGIVRDLREAERMLWLRRSVELHAIDLKEFTSQLQDLKAG